MNTLFDSVEVLDEAYNHYYNSRRDTESDES